MTGSDYTADLELAIAAARSAGEAIVPAFHAGQEVRFKSPNQPVTDADLAADRILRDLLLRDRPDYGWLSEETRDSPARLEKERLWVVDPIDGTNSFVKGIPEFGISVALVDRGEVVVGVLFNPVTGEMYHATAGGGAFLNGAPIHVSTTDTLGDARTLLGSRSDIRNGKLAAFEEEWTVTGLGSTAYKMAKVAEGVADAFVSSGPKAEWDVAAAALLVAEAGGRATDLLDRPFRYNQPDPSWRGVAATNGRLHQLVLALHPPAR